MSFRITTESMMEASMARFYYEEATDKSRWKKPEMARDDALLIAEATDRLHELGKKFEREVWYQGLQEITNACKVRGMQGEYNGVTFMSWCCAGRCMMTFRKEDGDWITLITADDEEPGARWKHRSIPNPNPDHWGPMGIQGIYATEQVAADLITCFIENWKDFNVQPDEEVTIAIPGIQ